MVAYLNQPGTQVMSDKALDNAMARRDSLAASINRAQQQIDGWRKELAKVDEFIAAWHAFAGDAESQSPAVSPVGALATTAVGSVAHAVGVAGGVTQVYSARVFVGTESKPKRPRHNSRKEEVAEAARAVIQERGEPMPRTDLFRALRERGLVIDGTDPEMVLSTMLWRMRERVARVKGGGYWLAEVPNPEFGYDPTDPQSEIESALTTPLDEARRLSESDKAALKDDGIEVDDDPFS